MTYIANTGIQILELGWDFEKDGGSVGEHELTNRGSAGRIPMGALILDVLFWGNESTVIESGATLEVGYEGYTAGYLHNIPAQYFVAGFGKKSTEFLSDAENALGNYEKQEFNLTAGGSENAVTNFKTKVIRVDDTSKQKVILKISGNTITSGKFVVGVMYYLPSINSIS